MVHIARPLAAALLATCIGMAAFAFASLWVPGSDDLPHRPTPADVLAFLTIFLTFPTVGASITWKQPRNPVGWLFLAIGLLITYNIFAAEYAALVFHFGAALPAPDVVAWVGSWSWNVAASIALPLALMLFPTGQLPTRRWQPAVHVGVAATLIVVAAIALRPGDLVDHEGVVSNPFAVGGPVGALATRIVALEFVPMVYMIVLSLIALATRSRRTETERQQLKWLLYPVAILVAALVALTVVPGADAMWTVVLVALAAIPVCAGIAILRYRLYDIDVVIRRTLVYAAVVAVLGSLYVTLALGLQLALSGWTGNDTLPVAVSTLAIAALFGPVRARIRNLVDRRFYRSRYDAQQTLKDFLVRVRDEVELEAVGEALVVVASAAVRPAATGLWMRRRDPA